VYSRLKKTERWTEEGRLIRGTVRPKELRSRSSVPSMFQTGCWRSQQPHTEKAPTKSLLSLTKRPGKEQLCKTLDIIFCPKKTKKIALAELNRQEEFIQDLQ
jgi:hypothetical protein